MDITIIFGLVSLTFLLAIFTEIVENALKLIFMLLTFLGAIFTINTLGAMANNDPTIPQVVIDNIWTGYRVSLYLYLALVLYVVIKLIMQLTVKHEQKPTTFKSPLQQYKEKKYGSDSQR